MGRRNKKGRNVTGIIVVDKPTGRSSNHVLQQVKRLFDAKKAGHTGNLDPLATGVLPVCLGEATKISSYLLDSDKRYRATCQLGTVTDSGDSDGQVVSEHDIPELSYQQFEDTLKDFIGEQQQVPPMFSALKHQGQPLYKLARKGIEVERKARTITIYDIQLVELNEASFVVDVCCSKGTYIRTLLEDICHAIGSGGHLTALRRTEAAGYNLQQALTLEQLESVADEGIEKLDELLLSAGSALKNWPEYTIDTDMVTTLRYGQTICLSQPPSHSLVKLFDDNGDFVGIGEMSESGVIAPKRVFVDETQQ